MGLGGSKSAATNTLKHCTIWKADRSPSCRTVMMALDAMNINITEVDLDMDKAEHRTAEIAVMNPLQTLPIFKDRELILCDSHAISTYLATRYCNSDKILPKDPGGRALVHQLMFYNGGVLHPRYCNAAYPVLYENCRFVMPQQLCDIESAYMDLENMIGGRSWFGGAWVTLGDIALASTVSTLNILVPIDKKRYPRLSCWLYRMSEEMFYVTANKKGLEEFTKRIVAEILKQGNSKDVHARQFQGDRLLVFIYRRGNKHDCNSHLPTMIYNMHKITIPNYST